MNLILLRLSFVSWLFSPALFACSYPHTIECWEQMVKDTKLGFDKFDMKDGRIKIMAKFKKKSDEHTKILSLTVEYPKANDHTLIPTLNKKTLGSSGYITIDVKDGNIKGKNISRYYLSEDLRCVGPNKGFKKDSDKNRLLDEPYSNFVWELVIALFRPAST